MAKSFQHPEPGQHNGSHSATGGELQQEAGAAHPVPTRNQGLALTDNQNSLRANARGPILQEDFMVGEKIV